ncbi:FlgD immunoglobulin-like domain containing protein [Streptomyces erythrochromogenes]|uniref:FlgD immunoglobulin-like domain containing protein n=1 Tax=Streptomyces erythrochromogenes TaxID=285574 RepID=UPI003870D63C|nr:hypothetical protein OG364_21480 [Streptomyces erythrochromogenes]
MRRSRVLGAAALALATGIGALTAVPAAAGPAAADELTIAPLAHQEPSYQPIYGAGPKGVVLARPSGGLYWKSFEDGREVPLADCATGPYDQSLQLGDTVGCERRTSPTAPGALTLHDQATGRTETVAAQAGRTWTTTFSPTQVLAYETDAEDRITLHLIGRENEARKDVTVSAPERIPIDSFWVRTSDEKGALITYRSAAGGQTLALLDYARATLTPLALPDGATDPGGVDYSLGSQWVSLRENGSGTATLRSRADLTVTRSVNTPTPYGRTHPVGDWLVVQDHNATSNAVTALPVAGGAPRTLLARASDRALKTGTDGSAYLAGGTDSSHWAMHRIVSGPDGAPVLSTVADLPPNPADRVTLSLAQGRLIAGQEDPTRSLQGYTVPVAGTAPAKQTPDWSCDENQDERLCRPRSGLPGWTVPTGDGRIVSLSTHGAGVAVNVRETRPGGTVRQVSLPGTDGMQPYLIKNASGRFVLFTVTEKNTPRLLVADIDAGKVLDFKPSSAATLWGATLWDVKSPYGLDGTDLRTGRVTQHQGSGLCRPSEIQVSGDWIYSLCPADVETPGVWHLPTHKFVSLPFVPERGRVQLGDGYLVRQKDNGLEVYNLRSGKAVRESGIAPEALAYGSDWTVDRFGGRLAYTGPDETVHLAGVAGDASPLALIDQDVAATADFRQVKTWQARWWLSKPVSSWKLTVRDKASGMTTTVRTGTDARGLIAPAWDGKSPTGAYLFSGEYEWTLTARPADGRGAEVSTSGTVSTTRPPTGGRPPARP